VIGSVLVLFAKYMSNYNDEEKEDKMGRIYRTHMGLRGMNIGF
jgi:hypothetical protein